MLRSCLCIILEREEEIIPGVQKAGPRRQKLLNWLCNRGKKTITVLLLSPTDKAVGFFFYKNCLREASLFTWHSWLSCRLLWGVGTRNQLGLGDVTCLTTPKTQPPQQTQHFSVGDYISNVSSLVWYRFTQNSYKPEGDLAFSCSFLYCSGKHRAVWKDLQILC